MPAHFSDIALPPQLLAVLDARGFTDPFPIQAATLPDALDGRDVLGRGQTGSGKTLAFGLPMLTRLAGKRSEPSRPRGLVLVPTRELALQVTDALTPFADALSLVVRPVVGGAPMGRQIQALRRGVDVLVATPGRLADHVRQGTCRLDSVTVVTLDEADQMADMGFLPQVTELLELVAPHGQRLLFSATLDSAVRILVRRFLTDPVEHSTEPATAGVTTMDHHLLLVDRRDKDAVVAEIAAREGRTILFARTQLGVDRLAEQLRAVGVHADGLHGGKAQAARTRVMNRFKEGKLPVLVATDVAARGIHVDEVSLVVHVDPPADAKDYLHRAGRTARAGHDGTVVTIVLHPQRRAVQGITRRAGVQARATTVRPGDEALATLTGARRPTGEAVIERPEPMGRGRYDARRPQGRRGAADYVRGRSHYRGQGRPGGTRPQRRAAHG